MSKPHSRVKEGIKLGLKDTEENHRILLDVSHLPSLYESYILLSQRVSQIMPKMLKTDTLNLALSQRPQSILPWKQNVLLGYYLQAL